MIEEEGKRAQRIADSDGELIRPKDLDDTTEAGPLSDLERRAIQFLSEITDSEVERVRTGTIRPKDMATRSLLGDAEARKILSNRVRKDQMLMDKIRATRAWRELDETAEQQKMDDAARVDAIINSEY